MRKILTLILLVVTLVSCTPIQQKVISFDVVAGQTIQSAINKAVAGDIIKVSPGNYPEVVNVNKNNITLEASGKVTVKAFYISGSNNVVRGFTITDPKEKAGIRVWGNNNLIENNEIFWTLEDGMWIGGNGNWIRNNNIHDILAPGNDVNDPHVDCFMAWNDSFWSYEIASLTIEGNYCNNPRNVGSNQIFILTHNLPSKVLKNIDILNNTFVVSDGGYNPVVFFGDSTITGVRIIGNKFYNTTGKGANPIYLQNMVNVIVKDNTAWGWEGEFIKLINSSVTQSNNISLPYSSPVTPTITVTLPPTIVRTNTPVVTPSLTIIPSITSTKTPTPIVTKTVPPTKIVITPTPTPVGNRCDYNKNGKIDTFWERLCVYFGV